MKVLSQAPRRGLSIFVFGLWVLLGCGGGEGTPGDSGPAEAPAAAAPMSAEVQALVDQGNAAQRAGESQTALGFYQEGMQLAPDHPIPQFGALMAAMALGDIQMADSLRTILQVSAPDLVQMLGPGNSMGGGQGDPHSGAGGLPPGHPVGPAPGVQTTPPDTVETV